MGYNGHRYDFSQMNMVGNPLGMMNQMPQPPQNQNQVQMNAQMNQQNNGNNGMNMPQTMMRPNGNEIPGSNLGFQMNPVSKNSKKK